MLLYASLLVQAGSLPGSTWVALTVPPQAGKAGTLFGLAVDPANNQVLLATTAASIVRSADGGLSWRSVYTGKTAVTTVAFSPLKADLVLAGTQGSGAVGSRDGGRTWAPATGLDGRTVRVFGFALTLFVAGTDRGVYASQDGFAWTPSGLAGSSIDALAVEAVHAPVRLVAGSDAPGQGSSLVLFRSLDSGASWTQFSPPISGTLAVRLSAGPLPPTGDTRPLVAGTNAGLFESTDNGSTFTPLSGGDLLPSIDYTEVAFIADHYDRFYVASDGGGSGSGGLWRTNDAGRTFTSLNPPVPSITALAVSNEDSPTLYVATFEPTDHTSALWAYHDTGGTPQGPALQSSPVASAGRTAPAGSGLGPFEFIKSAQFPYLLLGAAAVMVILAAMVAHLRGRRQ